MLKKIIQGLAVGLAAALAALLLWSGGALTRFEAKTWDWRVTRLAKPGAATDNIRLIFIDQYSLDWAKKEMGLKWPWPREVYKPILDFCRRQGARAVIFDMVYTEPSYMGVEDDRAFGAAIAETTGFVGTVFLGQDGVSTNWPKNLRVPEMRGLSAWLAEAGQRRSGWWRAWSGRERGGPPASAIEGSPRGRRSMPTATFPIPEVATNATLLGNVHATPDSDAIFRRLELFTVFDGKAVPCLGLAAYLVAAPDPTLSIAPGLLRIGPSSSALPQSKIENRKSSILPAVPIDRRGRALLNFRGPAGTHQRFTAAAVIQSELRLQEGQGAEPPIKDPAAFKDCYVFLGCNAPGLLDLRPTPISRVYPGAEIFATALDNLLSNDFMRDAPRWFTLLLVVSMGLLAGLLTRLGRNAYENVLVFVLAIPLPAVLCVAAYQRGFWLPFLAQESAVLFALVGAVLVNYATEGKQKRFIRGAFKQYLSETVIEQLTRHPERLTLGGEQRTLSIFFSDLQGFTTISEGLNPQELTALLNDYLTAMTDIIQEEGGTVDKYEGDAIIAFWNAPLAQDDHGARSVRAALRCQAKLAELRPALRERTGKDLFMRIGINTGAVVVGNMGSHNRFNYTILGDAANLASRLEGINKQFGTYTLISEATRIAMDLPPAPAAAAAPRPGEIAVREISRVAVVGRKTAVQVFEPMAPDEFAARREDFAVFAQGLAAYYAGRFAEAVRAFESIQEKDPPAAAYLRKCRALLAQAPAAWDGVWVMTEK